MRAYQRSRKEPRCGGAILQVFRLFVIECGEAWGQGSRRKQEGPGKGRRDAKGRDAGISVEMLIN
jgi:hypothetical protein